MNPIYEKLFDTYGDSTLRDIGVYDEAEMDAEMEKLPLDKAAKVALSSILFQYYYRWSTDAFALGLHLGLALAHDNIRRGCPQQL